MNFLYDIVEGALAGIVAAGIIWLIKYYLTKRRKESENKASGAKFESPKIRRRRRGAQAIAIVGFFIVGSIVWNYALGPRVSHLLIDYEAVAPLIQSKRWITYHPLGIDPDSGLHPSRDSLEQQLKWIREAGFTGIITFASDGTYSQIPELAKRESLSVIMGIWNPANTEELTSAISKRKFVDAYCVGHNGLNELYTYSQLSNAIRIVRFRTRRPVSFTEKLRRYVDDSRLSNLGDWIFPDVHLPIRSDSNHHENTFSADARRDAAQVIEVANIIGKQAASVTRPVLLKMITYPVDGIPNANQEEQALFFKSILEERRDATSPMPSNIHISVHSSFDVPWKRGWPYYAWDPYTGLLENDGTPRPAVAEIIQRLP